MNTHQPTQYDQTTDAQAGRILTFLTLLGVLGVLALIAGCTPKDKAAKTPSATPTTSQTTTSAPATTSRPRPTPPAATKPSLTLAQEQAIGSAKSYLELSGFSRNGLIKQLSSNYGEGYSKADAVFAVDYLRVNWNEQAVRSAKAYLEMTHFSRAGLIQQLSSAYGDEYTLAQATYAADHVGLTR